jgi:hypothetical protein
MPRTTISVVPASTAAIGNRGFIGAKFGL